MYYNKLKVRPVFYGLLYKVVLFSNNYTRKTISFHITHKGAVDWIESNKKYY